MYEKINISYKKYALLIIFNGLLIFRYVWAMPQCPPCPGPPCYPCITGEQLVIEVLWDWVTVSNVLFLFVDVWSLFYYDKRFRVNLSYKSFLSFLANFFIFLAVFYTKGFFSSYPDETRYPESYDIDSLILNNPGDKIGKADSLSVLHTVKVWTEKDYDWANPYYEVKSKDLTYEVFKVFRSPDSTRMIVWILLRKDDDLYFSDEGLKVGADKKERSFRLSSLVAVRDSVGDFWEFFPFFFNSFSYYDNQEPYASEFYRIMHADVSTVRFYMLRKDLDTSYGGIVRNSVDGYISQSNGYGLFDKDFWTKSLIWRKKDQNSRYFYIQYLDWKLKPFISYPDSILNLYSKED